MSETEVVEETPPKEQPSNPPKVSPIEVIDGALVPQDSSELNRTLAHIATGGGFPERFNTPEKRIASYNLAHSLMGGKWQLALNNIAEIKGQLCIYGELPGALAEQTKEVQEKEVYLIDSDRKRICLLNDNLTAEPWAGVCLIQRKGRKLKEFFYTMAQAEVAGQYPPKRRDGSINKDSPWMKFTGVMLMRKAMALGIKFEFADAMIGVPVAEYDHDEMPGIRTVSELNPDENSSEFAKKLDNLDS